MSASSVAIPPQAATGDCVVLRCVSWETYERLLADDEGRHTPRMTYDQGVLELVTPSLPHERDALTITRIVDIVAAMLGIPIVSTGGTTYRRRSLNRGFEPDASVYIQSEERVRGLDEIDLTIDPPPDVVLEMEMSRSAINKLRLFASMGIPEVWRCDGRRVTILIRDGDTYQESLASVALPVLTRDVLERFLAESRTMLSPEWFRTVSEWALAQRLTTD
jgi:Uma2 family endonuclease